MRYDDGMADAHSHSAEQAQVPTPDPARLQRIRRRLLEWLRPPRQLRTTSLGKIVIVFTIAIGVAAINTGNNLLYLVLGGLFGIITASGILSERVLRDIGASLRLPPVVPAGRPVPLTVRLHADKRVASWLIDLSFEGDNRRRFGRGRVRELGPGEARRVPVTILPVARGPLRIQRLRLTTRFPFQMYEKTRMVDLDAVLWVAPEPLEARLPPPAPRGQELARERRVRQGDDEFTGLRERVPTDPPSRIHWRRSATVGRLTTKVFQAEVARGLHLRLRQGESEAAFEQALRELSGYVEAAARVARSLHVDTGQGVRVMSGPEQRDVLWRWLAELQRESLSPGRPALAVVEEPS